jgi:hypothetical protein
MSNTTIGKIIILFLIGAAVSILVFSDFGNSNSVKVYDCSLAEWHPDFPKDVREACRKLKLESIEEDKTSRYI